MIPDQLVLPGYELHEQHEVDHFYLFLGGPWFDATPVAKVLAMVGIALVILGLLCLVLKRPNAGFVAGISILGALMSVNKLLYAPWVIANEFSDFGLLGYVYKHYTLYHWQAFLPLIIIAVIGIVAAVLAPIRFKR